MAGRNIQDLSPELLHMICVYLKSTEIAGICLLHRTIASVGLEYLVSQIHLIPNPDSFDRLLAVAEHAHASRDITSLFYEAELLQSLRPLQPHDERESWKKSIVAPDNAGSLEELQDPYFTAAWIGSNHEQHYTKRELQQGYKKYQSYRAEQRRINESAAYEEAMVRAMKLLSHPTLMKMSCGRGITNHFRTAFEAGLSEDVTMDPRMTDRAGASQLSILLSAADKTGLEIKRLVCGSLGQDFLYYRSLERIDGMKRSIQTIRSLHLFFSHIPEASDSNAEYSPNGSYSAGTDSMQFWTAAPNLETLSVRFDKDRPLFLLISNTFFSTSIGHA